jgi:hypothetical protein
MSDAHEARLLLAILRGDLAEADERSRGQAPRPDVFVELCRACDVHPFVHASLERQERFGLVGAEIERRLRALRTKCRMDNLLLLARTEEALDLLLHAGIVPIALKGLDVLHRFHPAFDERTLDDVDLLVPAERLEETFSVLEAAGWRMPDEPERSHWRRSSFEMPMTSPGPVAVGFEIHWSIGQERRYRVEARELFRRAAPLTVAGRAVLRLEENDAVAHLLLHHVQHYFDRRLKWALDLQDRVKDAAFDWGTTADRLLSWGGSAAAGLSLLHLRKLFPALVPVRATDAIPAAAWRRAVSFPLRSTHPLDYFRQTRRKTVQELLAAIAFERPWELPAYLAHRARRDRERSP